MLLFKITNYSTITKLVNLFKYSYITPTHLIRLFNHSYINSICLFRKKNKQVKQVRDQPAKNNFSFFKKKRWLNYIFLFLRIIFFVINICYYLK